MLGGHDHFYHEETRNGVRLIKGGMDFRYLAKIHVKISFVPFAPSLSPLTPGVPLRP